uniref:protein disulfide-isomerase n=1 Tax=Paramoeba aestuarina TaxID=180227 RepID=A0A7S4P9W3_9EUKA|mmetsp:Transcript_3891/g.5951  ORF Transcript_3891/g.5951 Transcript_3891/m.5951 type:complete len:465 (+) Transcript_3891:31-1425(+)
MLLWIFALLDASRFSLQASGVVEANSENFADLIENNLTFVEFYAPWCQHCQSIAPELDRAADRLKDTARIAKIDATQNEELARKHGVEGFPTLLIFHEGQIIPYKGERTSGEIVSFIKKLLAPAYITLKTRKELLNFQKGKQTKLIYYSCNEETPEKNVFLSYANANRDAYSYAMVTDTSLFENQSKDFIEMHKPFDNKKSRLEDVSEASFLRWLQVEGFRLVDELGPGKYEAYIRRGLPIAWLFVEDLGKESKEVLQTIRRVATNFKGHLSFVYLDVTKFPTLGEQFGLYDRAFPAFVIANQQQETFRFPKTSDMNHDEIRLFCQDFLDNKLTKTMRSQPKPLGEREDGLKIVVGSTFEESVLNSPSAVLISFIAPWCKECNALEAVLSEIAREFKDDSSIQIALIDVSKNDFNSGGFKFDGLPGVFFKAQNTGPIVYEGDRSRDDLLNFIRKHRSEGDEKDL